MRFKPMAAKRRQKVRLDLLSAACFPDAHVAERQAIASPPLSNLAVDVLSPHPRGVDAGTGANLAPDRLSNRRAAAQRALTMTGARAKQHPFSVHAPTPKVEAGAEPVAAAGVVLLAARDAEVVQGFILTGAGGSHEQTLSILQRL